MRIVGFLIWWLISVFFFQNDSHCYDSVHLKVDSKYGMGIYHFFFYDYTWKNVALEMGTHLFSSVLYFCGLSSVQKHSTFHT